MLYTVNPVAGDDIAFTSVVVSLGSNTPLVVVTMSKIALASTWSEPIAKPWGSLKYDLPVDDNWVLTCPDVFNICIDGVPPLLIFTASTPLLCNVIPPLFVVEFTTKSCAGDVVPIPRPVLFHAPILEPSNWKYKFVFGFM